jgi:acyl-CoA reductase-like NAD-dependent aldehyde dehydrogenase
VTQTADHPPEASATGAPDREPLVVHDPRTGAVVACIPDEGPKGVGRAVDAARAAAGRWAALPFAARAELVLAARDEMVDRLDEIVEVITSETGKLSVDAVVHELLVAAETVSHHARHGARELRPERARTGLLVHKRAVRTWEPVGVVGVIAPWNYPFLLAFTPLVTALLAGNAVVLKPSELTPTTGLVLGDLFASAGRGSPMEGAVQVVTGGGATGEALVRGGVDLVCFTGSGATGREVMRAAADSLTPVLLELGGKDPMIVCADADLERAAAGAVWGGLLNAGQTCAGVERVYVEDAAHDDFVARVVARARAVRVGAGPGSDIGTMASEAQVRVVERQLADAVANGGRILTGGRRVPGHGRWFEPTVVVDTPPDCTLLREETFGPVLPIVRVADVDEAVRLANDSTFGLSSSVWTSDPRTAADVTARLQAGSVCVNDVVDVFAAADLPFGGVKRSGIGRVHGPDALRRMSNPKSVLTDRGGLPREPWWFPLPTWLEPVARAVMVLRHRQGWRAKLGGLRRLGARSQRP